MEESKGNADSPLPSKPELEVRYLQKQLAKLEHELLELKNASTLERSARRFSPFIPLLTASLGIAAFCFGVYQYIQAENKSRELRETEISKQHDERTRAIEAATLESQRAATDTLWREQLSLYLKASENAALVATSGDEDTRAKAEAQFWMLYWGPMGAVEDLTLFGQIEEAKIEAAMVAFGNELKTSPRDQGRLKSKSLNLAHTIRNGIKGVFEVKGAKLSSEKR
ncbi:hypothetical protein NA78x_000835 [Anatilimnocola sp. NA78]|uniref:hypothetical protein n=1 Tax=Anatilimnocola sp. NA78 TaxID=3415683 RepID=UPI003CE48149